MKNAYLIEVIRAIESQTDYLFVYDKNEIDLTSKVDLVAENKSVADILSGIFNNTNIVYAMEGKNIMLMPKNDFQQQQQKSVSGKVTDYSGSPIPGVSVVVKGTTQGTITGNDGNYTLSKVPENTTLQFSFMGMKTQEVSVDGRKYIDIKMEENTIGLEEVVAIGYGSMKKSDLTGSISSVLSKDFRTGVISSSEQLLQGKVAGLTVSQTGGDPTSAPTIRLRGGTSLSASNSPLIVVDGVSGVDLSTVQPTEILSMDVLKDASATAIYGSRGANGVIIVTTSREKKGQRIEYSGYFAVGKAANNLDVLSADEWRHYVENFNLTDAVDYGANTDWQKEIQQIAISHSHSISFSSGGDNNGMRASVNYLKNEGIITFSDLERINATLSGYQYGLNDKLKLEFGLQANADKKNNVDNGIYSTIYNMNPTSPVRDENGEYTEEIGGRLTSSNPVETHTERTSEGTRKHLLGFSKAQLEIIQGLKATANISYEYNTLQGYYYRPSYVYKVTDGGYASRSVDAYTNKQIETFLNYDKQINEKNRFGAMAGYSFLDYTNEGFNAERREFDTDSFGWNNLGAGQDYRIGDVGSYKENAKLVSFFARANYNYKDRYMLTATVRRDGSSRFGDNHKWGTFPSVSAAWRVSEESFMESTQDWLANLKLRAGFGVTGNQAGIGQYKSMQLMGIGGGVYYDDVADVWKQSYGVTQNPNPDLKWESTAQTDIGLDAFVFDRINIALDWYVKKTSDLLYVYQVPTPPYLYSRILANVGDLTNKGVEVSFNANILNTRDFTWDVNLTLAHNKQEIDKLSNQVYQTDRVYSGELQGVLGMSNRFSQIISEGYPIGTFYGPRCEGLDENGKFILANEGKEEVLGNAQPKLTSGLAFNFSYRDFDLNFSGYGMFGQKVLNVAGMSMGYNNHMPDYNAIRSFVESGITGENMPVYSSFWLEDASFFRLQSATLGYTLPENLLKKTGINKIRFYVTGENLFVLTKYSGLDPEVGISSISEPGLDKGQIYPMPRTFSFGLNISF
ncbi:MAG: TonB-dependent receptor [Peptostreptococcaceae bacterium]|nr:TonB-dependent receptor [Peptostreptococcaceae bacterium]